MRGLPRIGMVNKVLMNGYEFASNGSWWNFFTELQAWKYAKCQVFDALATDSAVHVGRAGGGCI